MAIDEDKIKQIVNRSEFLQDILDRIPSWIIRWANTFIAILFILVALGLKVIKYPDVITSEILITVEKPPIEIYSRTSGRIIHLLKKDQENVKTGDWVIVLNNSANYKDVLNTLKSIETINHRDFWKSINELDLKEIISLGEAQNTYFQFIKSVDELKLFYKLNSQYRQLAINSKREDNLISLKQKLNNQLLISEKELAIVKTDFDRTLKLYSEGVVSKIELEQKEIAYLNAKDKVEVLNGTILNSQLQKDLLNKENTSLDIERNDSYFKLKNNVLQYYNALIFELSEWQNKYVLVSPIDGVISLYDIRSEDQFLLSEKKAFTVTPNNIQDYFAMIKLPISNSGKVHKGQKCIIKLHNYPYTEFGMLKGVIQSISATPKEGYYSVKVQLANQLTTTTNKKLYSKSELVGEAEIIIEDLTLFDRIFNIIISKNY